MLSRKHDPKALLENQYDKARTFIAVIDQWSERLKKSFKFRPQSLRKPENFMKRILDAQWRKDILTTTQIFTQTATLSFGGPAFLPGSPLPIFAPDRYLLWGSDYDVEIALYEMLTWMSHIDAVKAGAGNSEDGFGDISTQIFSRGLITERVLFDLWTGE